MLNAFPSPLGPSHPLQAFVEVVDQMRADPYLSPHIKYYMREMRVVAYAQVRECKRGEGWRGDAGGRGLCAGEGRGVTLA